MSHAVQGYPRLTDHSEEFWQNGVHWGRKWQPTPVFLPGEPRGHYDKAKRYDARRWVPQVEWCQVCYWGWCCKDLYSSLDCKEIKPVNLKGNQLSIFIGRNAAKAEASILCPPDAKSRFTGKDPDSGKNWGQKEKGVMGWLDGIIDSMEMGLI